MIVNLRLEGSDQHWVVTQPSVHIGRGADCDISVPAEKYPMVSREHLVLQIENGQVRFTDSNSANGTFVNGKKLSSGRIVSGDVIQLGNNGPKLMVEVDTVTSSSAASSETMVGQVGAPASTPASVAPTMIGFQPGGHDSHQQETMIEDLGEALAETLDPDHQHHAKPAAAAQDQATIVGRAAVPNAEQPTMVRKIPISGDQPTMVRPVASDRSEMPTMVAKASDFAPKSESPTVVVPGFEVTEYDQQEQEEEAPADELAEQEEYEEENAAEESAAHSEHAVDPETGLTPEEEEMLERKLDSMKNLVMVLTVLMVALIGFAFYQSQQIDKNIKAVQQLQTQAASAVKSLTPELDMRMNALDKRLDSVDGKMKAAEDRMVSRMNQEIPAMLDKYVNKKMDELNRQAGSMQPR